MEHPSRAQGDKLRDEEVRDLEHQDYNVAAAGTTNHDEPLDSEGDEKSLREIQQGSSDGEGDEEDEKGVQSQRAELNRAKSYATTTSVQSTPVLEEEEKSWSSKINPFKWGKVRPVPEEREISREYTAGFLSMLYFQWVAPIMSVSFFSHDPDLACRACADQRCRPGTSASSIVMTSGKSILIAVPPNSPPNCRPPSINGSLVARNTHCSGPCTRRSSANFGRVEYVNSSPTCSRSCRHLCFAT